MKKYLLSLLLASLTLFGLAQQKTSAQPTNTPKFFKQPDLDKFLGRWVYEKNGMYFCIRLEKYSSLTSNNDKTERLTGTHLFKQNGEIIDEKGNLDSSSSIEGGNLTPSNKNLIRFRFKEYRRRVVSSGTMEYVEGPTPSILWKLNPNERRNGIILQGKENIKDPEFIVPTNITLYKVK